jgi:predicted DNA-binding transcriptional regulator AlpA
LIPGETKVLDAFVRKPDVMKFTRLGSSEFHERIRLGTFPKPDAYLGPRSPVWLESTLKRWQAEVIAQPQTPTRKVGRK